jgi:tetratricopeptide (TPR) repeat protein
MMRAASPHFELIAPCRKEQCLEILKLFEWTRLLFERNFQFQPTPRKTLIYVSRSYRFWQELGPAGRAEGFYADMPSRGHIVLRSLERWQTTGLHEFAHLWMRQKMARPIAWIDEGIACYFEGLRAEKQRVLAGLPVRERLMILRRERWLPFERIFGAGHSGSFPREAEIALFYSQSWAIIHMMRLSPEFAPRFKDFLSLVAAGADAADALVKTYGISPPQLWLRSKQWIEMGNWPVEMLEAPENTELRMEVSPAEDAVVDLVEATLAAARRTDAARGAAYREMAGKLGGACEANLALGDLAYNLGLLDRAAKHYQAAIACGVPAAEIGRGIELAAAGSRTLTERQLEEIEAVTNDRSLRASVAVSLYHQEDFEGVLRTTQDLGGMRSDALFRASRVRALALLKLGRLGEAEELARRLGQMAADEFERQSARLLLDDIAQQGRAAAVAKAPMHEIYLKQLQRADGIVTRVDCMGSWVRLWVRSADGRQLRLRIADPQEVVTGDGEGEPIDLHCGPQERRAVIGYQQEVDEASGTQGRVKYFRPQN